MIKNKNERYSRYNSKYKNNSNIKNNLPNPEKFANIVQIIKSNRIMKVALILLGCMMLVICMNNIEKCAPSNVLSYIFESFQGAGVGGGYPAKIEGNKVINGNLNIIDNDVSILSDTSFEIMNKYAKKIVSKKHTLANPMIKISGSKAILYDIGGRNVQIESQTGTIYKFQTENDIISADLSANGEYITATYSNGYIGEIIAYTSRNIEKYRYYFSDYYITDVSISKDGKSAIASGVSSKNGKLQSALYIFNFNRETPKKVYEYEDNFIFKTQYFADERIVAIGDKSISFTNYKSKTKNDFDYEDKNLTNYKINPKLGVTISLSSTNDNRNCDVIVFNTNGKQKTFIETDLKVDSISFNNDIVAILSDSHIYEYTYKPRLKGQCFCGMDSKKIELISSKLAYVLGTSELRKLKLKLE